MPGLSLQGLLLRQFACQIVHSHQQHFAELGIDRKLLLDDYTSFVDYPCNVRLQEVRKQLNMTQIEIAEKIGVASTAYSGWERAVKTPRRKEYENIVAVLNEYNISL